MKEFKNSFLLKVNDKLVHNMSYNNYNLANGMHINVTQQVYLGIVRDKIDICDHVKPARVQAEGIIIEEYTRVIREILKKKYGKNWFIDDVMVTVAEIYYSKWCIDIDIDIYMKYK